MENDCNDKNNYNSSVHCYVNIVSKAKITFPPLAPKATMIIIAIKMHDLKAQ